ncbi:hypothetical protein SeLEV6574_g00784 [Synchytrium endobioticum]|nr:hypothetical protein SeLEV6574_g00784 [Synchytrium endobioticum]
MLLEIKRPSTLAIQQDRCRDVALGLVAYKLQETHHALIEGQELQGDRLHNQPHQRIVLTIFLYILYLISFFAGISINSNYIKATHCCVFDRVADFVPNVGIQSLNEIQAA